MPHRAPHPDSSVSTPGMNSARWRSLAPRRAPHRSRRVSLSRWRRAKSSFEKGSASSWSGVGANASRPPSSSTSSANSSKPSSPSTSISVMTGKWLIPSITGRRAVWGLRKAMARSMQKPPTSWHRPTVLTRVSRTGGAGERGHGVGDVEQPGVGALVFHVVGDAGEHGDVAQRPADATGADGVSHRLGDAVSGGDVDVEGHGGEPARGDGDHDEVRAFEGFALVRGRRHRGLGAQLVVGDAGDGLHLLERAGVDVLEDEVHPRKRGKAQEISDELG